MSSRTFSFIRLAACAATLAMPVAANAQQEAAPVTDVGAATVAVVLAPSPFGAAAIVDDDLQTITGREDTSQIATASQTAGVSRNSVGDNSTTGDAKVSDNAFQNLSGLSILNVNTGNNVAINAAMNVNITITPGR